MSNPHRVYLWLINMPIGHEFISNDVALELTPKEKASACNHLRGYGVLEVIGKRSWNYIYRFSGLIDDSHSWHPKADKGDHTGAQHLRPHKLFRAEDFPTTVTTVTDKRNGIEHTTHHKPRTYRFSFPVTGRVSSGQPELRDLQPQGQQVERDFTPLEERVVAHMLSQLTDDQLLAELKRRMGHGD